MDIHATPEELMLRDATRAYLEAKVPLPRVRELSTTASGYDQASWREAAELGWFGLLVPERVGGAGLGSDGLIAAAVVAEELGRMLYPGPFLPVNVVADALVRGAQAAVQKAVVPSLVDGSAVAAWAVAGGPDGWDGRSGCATARGNGAYMVSATKRWVQDASSATHLLVTCATDDGGLVQFLLPTDAPGVEIVPLETMDLGRRLADVTFADVEAGSDAVVGDAAAAAHQLRLAVALQCAETVGATSRILEMTVDYAKARMAFGRPIGAFQAVKHHLAESVTRLEAAQAATWAAVRAVAADTRDAARLAHIAKAFVSAHCAEIVEVCMQVHGGIAMTWEHDAHLYLRRVQSNRMLFGSPAWHADRLCDVVGVAA